MTFKKLTSLLWTQKEKKLYVTLNTITQMFPSWRTHCCCCNFSMSCQPHPRAWIVQIVRQTLGSEKNAKWPGAALQPAFKDAELSQSNKAEFNFGLLAFLEVLCVLKTAALLKHSHFASLFFPHLFSPIIPVFCVSNLFQTLSFSIFKSVKIVIFNVMIYLCCSTSSGDDRNQITRYSV